MWKQWVAVVTFTVLLLSLHVLPGDGIGQQLPSDPQHRVVMHLNSGDEKVQRGALNNIRHLYQEVGREHLQLELVVHGAGLSLLIKGTTGFGSELAHLKREYGVQVTACSNTMKARNVTREQLLDEVGDTVPAMVRLMERQEHGWAYIKP
jgi:uncharacterized protein